MIGIGSDHGGFALKETIKKHLEERGLEYKDYGTYSSASCDYPVYGRAVAKAVAAGECELGILICGTGIGISITANKVPGVRAALCSDCFPPPPPGSIMMPISWPWAPGCWGRDWRSRSWTPSWIRPFPMMSAISAALP